jgi:mono/diheme cytochrome c family protein
MKKLFLLSTAAIVFVIFGFISFVFVKYPDVEPARDINVSINVDSVKRGEYLANHVAVCMDCHSKRDWTKYSGPIIDGTLGQGGEKFDESMDFPGHFFAGNITPFNLKNWTDGEIIRAFTSGVNREGTALFPVMPYLNYGKIAEPDAKAIVAYLRQIPEIDNTPPNSEANFPMNIILRTIPQNASLAEKAPPKTNQLRYGEYLTNIAGCMECHTKANKGENLEGMNFAGGFEFKTPKNIIRSSNITPDKETGIGSWDEEQFVARFKKMDPKNGYEAPSTPMILTVMPWVLYAGMEEDDLKAIFHYLKSLPPIKNKVVTSTTL